MVELDNNRPSNMGEDNISHSRFLVHHAPMLYAKNETSCKEFDNQYIRFMVMYLRYFIFSLKNSMKTFQNIQKVPGMIKFLDFLTLGLLNAFVSMKIQSLTTKLSSSAFSKNA